MRSCLSRAHQLADTLPSVASSKELPAKGRRPKPRPAVQTRKASPCSPADAIWSIPDDRLWPQALLPPKVDSAFVPSQTCQHQKQRTRSPTPRHST